MANIYALATEHLEWAFSRSRCSLAPSVGKQVAWILCCSQANLLPANWLILRLPQAELVSHQHQSLLDRRSRAA